jgi:hypothetical protein
MRLLAVIYTKMYLQPCWRIVSGDANSGFQLKIVLVRRMALPNELPSRYTAALALDVVDLPKEVTLRVLVARTSTLRTLRGPDTTDLRRTKCPH